MGYETRLIIGTKHDNKEKKGIYVIIVAEVDLCKSCFHDTYLEKDDTLHPAYFTDFSGKEITKDLYNAPLYCVDPSKVLAKIKLNNKETPTYRRYDAAIAVLEALIPAFHTEQLTCLLYGH